MTNATQIDLTQIAKELKLSAQQVASTVALLDDGNTVPFITRYRKEQTGDLDEEQIRAIEKRIQSARQLAERASAILRLIDSQGKLTDALKAQIEQAESLKRLEDLYLPYRPKRTSRATQAKERGLEPIAERIWSQDAELTDLPAAFLELVDSEKELPSIDEVSQGVVDILAERIGEDAEIRQASRKIAWKTGKLTVHVAKAAEKEKKGQEYRDYFDYKEPVTKIPPHRILAINRGEKANVLKVKFDWDQNLAALTVTEKLNRPSDPFAEFVKRCIQDALQRFIHPGLDREIRRELTDSAEHHAVTVFAKNLSNLLRQPPLQGQRVLAMDPGYRTGCKLAVLDELGNRLHNDLIYVTGSAEKKVATRKKLADMLAEYNCQLMAIGNGTACRETEELVSETIAEHCPEARYLIVNEAGASVYSASPIAREEFPDLDATIRGTISIGRRLQDPLSELVKIDPQHLGVGMYQHDVHSKLLKESLDSVIESCVNFVGVNLNSASAAILRHVSGLNQLVARRIVEWRDQNGSFKNRQQLLEVSGLGEAKFTQAAGFLKIADSDEPLDGTWIHPESYPSARKVLERLSMSAAELVSGHGETEEVSRQIEGLDLPTLAAEIGIGEPTLKDILETIVRPGRDPRTDMPGPVFKQDVLKLSDLSEGMELTGTVLNVVDFGAFIDIGLKDSALVHISQLSANYIRSPHDCVALGATVTVWVLGIDAERKRVALTMVKPGTEIPAKRERPAKKDRPRRPAKPRTARPDQEKRPPRKPKQKRKPQKPAVPLPKLSDEMKSGEQPLSGFDELKALWHDRKK